MRRALLVAVLAGLVAGTFLAGLPYAGNDHCFHYPAGASEGTTASGGTGLWPYGTRCEFTSAEGSRVVEHAAGTLEGLAWVAVAMVLFVVATVSRSPAARGAAGAAALLALVAFAWHFGGEAAPAGLLALTAGFALVYAVDRALWAAPSMGFVAMVGKRTLRSRWRDVRPSGPPTAARSAAMAAAVTPATLTAWALGHFADQPYAGVAAGIAAGALASAAAAALVRPRAQTAVAP